MITCEQEFEIKFKLSGDDTVHSVTFHKDIDCVSHFSHYEECHGHHAVHEMDEQELSENTDLWIEKQTDEDIKDLIVNYYGDDFIDEDQYVTDIISFKLI